MLLSNKMAIQGGKPIAGVQSYAREHILDVLVSQSLINPKQAVLLAQERFDQEELSNLLIKQKIISEERLVKAFSILYDLPFVHLIGRQIPDQALAIIPESVARMWQAVAYEVKTSPSQATSTDKPASPNSGGLSSSQGLVKTIWVAVAAPWRLKRGFVGPLSQLESTKSSKIYLGVTTKADFAFALKAYKRRPKDNQKITLGPVVQLPFVDLTKRAIPPAVLGKFPPDLATKYQMIVFEASSPDHIKVALLNPTSLQTRSIIEFIERRNAVKIDRFVTDEAGFRAALALYRPAQAGGQVSSRLLDRPTLNQDQAKLPWVGGSQGLASPAVKPVLGPVTRSPADRPIGSVKPSPSGPATSTTSDTKQPVQPIRVLRPTKGPVVVTGNEVANLATVGTQVKPVTKEDLEETNLDRVLGSIPGSIEDVAASARQGLIVRLVAAIISYGVAIKASDVHLEPQENQLRLRFRVDGELAEYLILPLELAPPIISRIKIMSQLKIDEQRVPQDGRMEAVAGGHEVDIRVSTFPIINGEKVVMRLLDKSTGALSIDQLGIVDSARVRLDQAIVKPYGIILVTGPTGSGKSTTLYAVLQKIATPNVNVITLEDPVEYELKGINQAQVKPKIGFSFADGLRSILRQDPNIIMVGEVRDGETASLVTHAALTGHLVLTTLHTNDASSALPRLINMGVEPFLIISAIQAIVGQRLIRKLCQNCVQPIKLSPERQAKVEQELGLVKAWQELKASGKVGFKQARGCDQCTHGFKGRIGIYEVLVRSEAIEQLALKRSPASEIASQARKEGMITMVQDGFIKAARGLTTIDEVLKETSTAAEQG